MMSFIMGIRIVDHDNVLSTEEKQQIESMASVRLAPIKDQIDSASFQITRHDHYRYGGEYETTFSIKLSSGKIVEAYNRGFQKLALILISMNQAIEQSQARLSLQSNWLYRASHHLKKQLAKLTRPPRRRFTSAKIASPSSSPHHS